MVSNAKADEQSQRHKEHEIRDMISKLTRQLTALGKSSALSGRGEDEEADDGVRIITPAGGIEGARMEANSEEMVDTHVALYAEEREMSAYTNSNYQAINNSILLGGSCTADDPGVHVVMSGYAKRMEMVIRRKKKKQKKKDKELKEKEERARGERHSEEEGDEKSGDGE
ncbi:101 kDa malaria antigen [Cocos nucifera]|uniref:101 kDa malaria antigen n=1 Tax=Cocos nucifera TaxID=13894 RepID=A0A8K0IMK8_COCNU|nr:101 kDa malaria antigen [Cocos nucifera]